MDIDETKEECHSMPEGDDRYFLLDQLEEHRFFLFRVARLQLNREEDAHDVIQETFTAALLGVSRFSNEVPLRTWLLGILRNKIIDAIRIRSRYVELDTEDDINPSISEFDPLFDSDDSWHSEVMAQGVCPQNSAIRSQLLDIIEFCVTKLPNNTGRAFLMREFLEMDFDEIAEELELKAGNLRVLLYRARMRLRECVSRGWGDLREEC